MIEWGKGAFVCLPVTPSDPHPLRGLLLCVVGFVRCVVLFKPGLEGCGGLEPFSYP